MSQTDAGVTVFLEVYNEESRIDSCLKSFAWADEVVIFDKHSTDRTVEIASRYASKILSVPSCEASENVIENIANSSSRAWCLFPTASSLMTPQLAKRIIEITSKADFPYDVIGLPYKMYSMGINSKHSPFWSQYKYTLIRRSALIVSTHLHREISFKSKRIYKLPADDDEAVLYHCTHENLDSYISQTLRYTTYEAKNDQYLSKRKAFCDIGKAVVNSFVRRRSALGGWDTVALSLMYINYYILRFLRVWARSAADGSKIYADIRKRVDMSWDKYTREIR